MCGGGCVWWWWLCVVVVVVCEATMDIPDSLQLALLVIFYHQLVHILYFVCGGPPVACAGGIFLPSTSTYIVTCPVVVVFIYIVHILQYGVF